MKRITPAVKIGYYLVLFGSVYEVIRGAIVQGRHQGQMISIGQRSYSSFPRDGTTPNMKRDVTVCKWWDFKGKTRESSHQVWFGIGGFGILWEKSVTLPNGSGSIALYYKSHSYAKVSFRITMFKQPQQQFPLIVIFMYISVTSKDRWLPQVGLYKDGNRKPQVYQEGRAIDFNVRKL